ncbi:DNA ligase [Bradyrhizobium sacchari]|uniref:ATP dependent DNA ligase-like protein n=1 Tax=Bradyrhizobium sacchari TaxID=1399419 RepID=A0A560KL03_9BRAD|nr:RNA ligase family protein [Bradyrhizobium sacchari]OPY95781.1 DNA ligase [Bradyrhizobium sacchari]TWB66651.1 ATP dependent DNA ligase-like protein [Bradyrhizobium sacchari]TWB83887.1 ATP dependent DNA ligase-like protein [Bradyrhizobium sacchari]
MPSTFEFCLPTAAKTVPEGPDWFHEIKYDGYRLRLEHNGRGVRLITRNAYNWTNRFPLIMQAALRNREQQFVIDGEAVILGVDVVSDFDALHSRQHDDEVQLYAFDVLTVGGEDLRQLPLETRKTNLARVLRGRPDGIFIAPFESGAIGPDLFRAACDLRLEGIVSKRRDRPYVAGRTHEWRKIKNHSHPA